MADATDSYLAKGKLTRAPGAKSGTLAADMDQGPVYDRAGSSMNLTENMHNPGARKTGKQSVTAKLRSLMRQ